ncbi:bcl-2-binding component 3, isoforms 3/4-like [Rattus rattus]|uniref:bcl-2-binding component 3, isoforms 3/4-like n=1 Tax=Rattus rattus TaxID=10117 RepID=UPI0013F2E5B0|nr:bcl-2-binding component 3, isoforms 3/4-like [Rattus rattus]
MAHADTPEPDTLRGWGAPDACPSLGREVRRAVLRSHSPPQALRRRLAVGVRSRVRPPQSPHAGAQGSGLPRVCADPCSAAASPSPAPAPFPARPQRLPGRTYLLAPRRAAPGCTASAAGGLGEGTGQGGSGGSWSAADRAPPAAGESAGRVSVGRETEAAAGARPPPPLEPPLSRPRALPGETRG